MSSFASFRDPRGRVILTDNKVWRLVSSEWVSSLEELLNLQTVQDWQQNKTLVNISPATQEETARFNSGFEDYSIPDFSLFTHRRIDFPSFPYEWAPEMLHDAGKLTLDIAEGLLDQGWSIKDGTPYNILFQGPEPVFIDILSFEKRNDKDPIWLPYSQFVQTFLLPLLVNRELQLPLSNVFLANRDGLQVADAAALFGKFKKLKPGILSLVTLPNLLSKRAEDDSDLYKSKNLKSAEQAQFILKYSFKRLRKYLVKVAPVSFRRSKWTDYTNYNRETIPEYMREKQTFVTETVKALKSRKTLDVGCNTGFFSFLAARAGAAVVAIDHDPAVVGQVYREAKNEKLNVLPLVLDLSRPTPRLGWRYSENPSFLDRAEGRFDLVMMLAVIHHMLVQERIPLREILRLAADLTTDALIIEFVPPSDKLFRRLARGREHLHQDLTEEKFIKTAKEFFNVVNSRQLPQTERSIYLMRKK